MALLSSDAMFLWSFSLGISYAELRYDVPSNISTVGSEPSASVNSSECNNLSNDHKEADSANHKGGMLFCMPINDHFTIMVGHFSVLTYTWFLIK